MIFQTNNVFEMIKSLYTTFIHYAQRLYIIFWHELSLDKRVRPSPFVPPPENEVKMPLKAKISIRSSRIWILLHHILAVIGLYYCLTKQVHKKTIIFAILLDVLGQIGIVCGAHRYWCHHSFKAKWPLQVFLMVCQTLSSQYCILFWVKIHRVHHKFSDTPRDPHNINAGLFFSHIGWILIQRLPEVTEELRKIYVDDLKKDKIVMFQQRYYVPLSLLICYTLPAVICWYFWSEIFFKAFCVAVSLRFVILLHQTLLTNSLAHVLGKKPFDKNIKAGDSKLAWFLSFGDEGWHNYHHAFPWDYKASDYWGYTGGICVLLVEFWARLGWAYNLKTTSSILAAKRRQRSGDLSCHAWGWHDTNVDPADRALTQIDYKKN